MDSGEERPAPLRLGAGVRRVQTPDDAHLNRLPLGGHGRRRYMVYMLNLVEEIEMLKRAWMLVAAIWALAFFANGSTKASGIGEGDIALAAAPLIFGWLATRAGRFVARGKC
jgi:hypothetical protein